MTGTNAVQPASAVVCGVPWMVGLPARGVDFVQQIVKACCEHLNECAVRGRMRLFRPRQCCAVTTIGSCP